MKNKFKLTIHMVSSLDGLVAKKDNSISWFEVNDYYDNGVLEPNPEEFLKTIDCYVMGSGTYLHAIHLSKLYGWPYGNTPTLVLSNKNLSDERKNIEFYSGDLKKLMDEKIKLNYKNVWLVGGPSVIKEFIRLKLANEIRLSILPIILGEGIPFFDRLENEHPLHLKEVTAYKSGMVELCYDFRGEE